MQTLEIQNVITRLAGSPAMSMRPPPMLDALNRYIADLEPGKRIFPDEREVLAELCRLIDGEEHAESAWQQTRNINETLRLNKPASFDSLTTAVVHNIQNSTVAYFDAKRAEAPDGINLRKVEVASGVFVGIGGRIFLATTAHSILNPPTGRIAMIGGLKVDIRDNVPQILSFGFADDEELKDVAFLEVEKEFVEQQLKKTAIPLSRIYPCGAGQDHHQTFACGYPGLLTENAMVGQRECHSLFTMQSWANTTLTPDEWTILPEGHRPCDPAIDVFIPYPLTDEICKNGTPSTETLVEPFGMSGGGYWQPNLALQESVWTPEYYCLIAIQSRWWKRGRYLQATQVIHWLRLVWEHHRDLRRILEDAFPTAAFRSI